MSKVAVEIELEFTPNPNTLKYAMNRQLLVTGAEFFRTRAEAEQYSPLALKLFDLGQISAVMVGPTFVTITLAATDNLRELNNKVMATLKAHLEAGAEICRPREHTANAAEDALAGRIRALIDEEIRPAVATDGGDITFERFEAGVVYLFLKGACAGCPRATMTLKMGIEQRLKQVFPEVQEVLALA